MPSRKGSLSNNTWTTQDRKQLLEPVEFRIPRLRPRAIGGGMRASRKKEGGGEKIKKSKEE